MHQVEFLDLPRPYQSINEVLIALQERVRLPLIFACEDEEHLTMPPLFSLDLRSVGETLEDDLLVIKFPLDLLIVLLLVLG